MNVFRVTSQGVETTSADDDWVEEMLTKKTQGGYIRSTVRREITSGMHYDIMNLSNEKMNNIRSILTGASPRTRLDSVAEMYI